jgi:hypothetical protein
MSDLVPNRSKRREGGFSMVELLLVITIGMILTAQREPSFNSSIYLDPLTTAVAMSSGPSIHSISGSREGLSVSGGIQRGQS